MRNDLDDHGRAWGGAVIACIGFGWWALMIVLREHAPGLPDALGGFGSREVVTGVSFGLAGLACVLSVVDLARGVWGRGARGLAAGVVLLAVTWVVWLGAAYAGSTP